jgi:transcriptional regulator with XRE-family HTH domain
MNIDHKFKQKLAQNVGPLSFALFMRVARQSLNLTQKEFGEKLKLSPANICDIEKGRQLVSTDLAVFIAKKAGLPEKMALQACLQDQVRKAGLTAKVAVL